MLVQVCITSFGILSGDMHLYVHTYIHVRGPSASMYVRATRYYTLPTFRLSVMLHTLLNAGNTKPNLNLLKQNRIQQRTYISEDF